MNLVQCQSLQNLIPSDMNLFRRKPFTELIFAFSKAINIALMLPVPEFLKKITQLTSPNIL